MHWIIYVIIGFIVLMIIPMAVQILAEYQRGVIFRLGRLVGTKGPGLFLIIPFVDRMVKIDLRVVTMDIPPVQKVTRDNVNVQAGATMKFKVLDPVAAATAAPDHIRKTSEILQTTFQNMIKESARDELEYHLNEVNRTLQRNTDKETRTWGVEVVEVEVKKMSFT